jgi:hypothetical protein
MTSSIVLVEKMKSALHLMSVLSIHLTDVQTPESVFLIIESVMGGATVLMERTKDGMSVAFDLSINTFQVTETSVSMSYLFTIHEAIIE